MDSILVFTEKTAALVDRDERGVVKGSGASDLNEDGDLVAVDL